MCLTFSLKILPTYIHTNYLHDLLHFKMPTFCKHSPLLENIQNTNSFVFIAMIV